jgi:hypothetical protein
MVGWVERSATQRDRSLKLGYARATLRESSANTQPTSTNP